MPLWSCGLDEGGDDGEGEDTFEEFLWEGEYCGARHDGEKEKAGNVVALMVGVSKTRLETGDRIWTDLMVI